MKERQTTSVFLPWEPHELLASLPLICDVLQLLCCKLQDFIFLLPQHPCKCGVNSPFDSSGTPVWWDFSLPQVPLLASSDCDLGTFKCTIEFLSQVFLVQVHHDFWYCHLPMGLHMPFWGHHCMDEPVLRGSVLSRTGSWEPVLSTSPTYQPDAVWWLWLLRPMRMVNLVAQNSPMTPPQTM